MNKTLEQLMIRGAERLGHRILSKSDKFALEQKWLEDQVKDGLVCARCERKDMPTVDHIIPVSILTMFGVDTDREYMPDNYQLLCRPCNSLKANRLDFANKKTKELLLKFLERV